ncbi:hypothetical protein AB0N38_33795 [Micromonospora aurantiaca]|uniref:DUF2268 domain-containing protein n=1 Tax=Micromonospora aurantiaca (nom. illeg.) TaxID=47850 RepID=A0ABQ6UNM8_9ACTN|nr:MULTISPECIES: hypothetical protein [Micromonospora]KAB1118631.1 hypothetical protein F6X54_02585 [Micromonospora aurantiaca]MDG4752830.1 hypothetical protein [Micromonospora sp. WMMD718]
MTYRVARPLPDAQQAAWQTVLAEFTAEVPDPRKVEVVITDEYDKVVAEYMATEVDLAFDAALVSQYRADRADGARAAAKTSPQPDGKVVVVVGTRLAAQGLGSMRHCLLHEAQHVRLHQHGDAAHAVHRRVPFELPKSELTWEYLWFAQSTIDEFRCERTVHERGWTSRSNLNTAADFASVVGVFQKVHANHYRTRDLKDTHREAFGALMRMATVLGYGAAGLVTGVIPPGAWVQAPAMGMFVDVLEDLPGTDVVVPREDLADTSVEVAKRLRQLFNDMGFDYRYTPDGDWFAVA